MRPPAFIWLHRLRAWLARPTLRKGLETQEDSGKAGAGTPPRPPGPLIWICGSDDPVGDIIQAAQEARPELNFLVTAASTGAVPEPDDLAILVQPLPPDGPRAARIFLDHWKPDIGLVFASTLPPSLIAEAAARAVPLLLMADQIPPRTLLNRALLRRFDHVLTRDPAQSLALRRLGLPAARSKVVGRFVRPAPPLPCNETERENLARLLAGRPSWLAAGTTPQEDAIAVLAHSMTARLAHRLLLILVPDDPARGPDLAGNLRREGWRVARRSADEEPDEETQIFIADTEGELGLWLRLSPVTFLGGSLSDKGGIDPFAASALGSAIVHGPNPGAHADRCAWLDAAGATRKVSDASGLSRALGDLLSPEKAARLAHEAWDVSTTGALAIERIVQTMLATLEKHEAA